MNSPWLTRELELCSEALSCGKVVSDWERLYLGFDLGTTNMVLVALNEKGTPVAAVLEPSMSSVRDGVIVDYMASIAGMKNCLKRLYAILGDSNPDVIGGAAAYPPGVASKTAKVCANVVEALGYECLGLYEEPSAAAEAIDMRDGVIVDIGGGTTGISVLRDGEVIHSHDEPTGGTHMTLVIAGSLGIDFEEAEMKKRSDKETYAPILRPVLEKMASIVRDDLDGFPDAADLPVVMVGGGADIPGAESIMSEVIGIPISMAPHTLCVTPLGIARSLWRENHDI